jgi:hypothetical protein
MCVSLLGKNIQRPTVLLADSFRNLSKHGGLSKTSWQNSKLIPIVAILFYRKTFYTHSKQHAVLR